MHIFCDKPCLKVSALVLCCPQCSLNTVIDTIPKAAEKRKAKERGRKEGKEKKKNSYLNSIFEKNIFYLIFTIKCRSSITKQYQLHFRYVNILVLKKKISRPISFRMKKN